MRHSILLTLALLAAGCATTPMVWTKTGATEVSVTADLRDCHTLANSQAWRMSWARRWPPGFYNPRYMPPYYHNPRPFWLGYPMSLETQQALVEFCMHSKGYRLERLPY
jgi:hypothetical protein